MKAILWPFRPPFTALGWGTTTEKLGRAMIDVAFRGYRRPVLEMKDIAEASVG